jgi:TPR repeat protein
MLSLGSPALAAPALSAQRQAQLDRAVIDYASGHFDAARRAFEVLARRRVAVAEFNLAAMHLRDEVPRPDRALARRLLERSARGGFVMAQTMLGRSLENGDFGPRELERAHDWYERAARGGDVDAQLAMGTAHYLGRGRPRDPALAAQWYREAAKGGDVGAMYLLASMYEQGDGVERDLRLARYWYEAAARSGDEAAPGKVRELDGLMGRAPS